MVTFIRFQSDLFNRLELAFLQFFYFLSEHLIGGCRRVDTARLDGDNDMSSVFEETLGVVDYYPGLIRLCNVREDDVYC